MTHKPAHEVELYRDGNAYEVYIDLPGYDSENIDVRWHDNRLHVEAEGLDDEGTTRVYNRYVSVPKRVDPDGITATYGDDVLEVHLPIVDESAGIGQAIDVEDG